MSPVDHLRHVEVAVDPDGVAESGDEYTYEEVLCSLDNYVAMRETGKPRAELVNDELLFIEVISSTMAATS